MQMIFKKITIIILTVLLFAGFSPLVHAQELTISDTPAPSVAPTAVPVEYTLPYPGLLPDSPFYFFKVIRDRIMGFLTSNSLRKAELDLLQADKRIEATRILFAKNRTDLGQSTLSKALNYLEGAIKEVEEAKQEGMPTGDIVKRLTLATHKYKEVISEIKKKSKMSKDQIGTEEARFDKLREKVEQLVP